MAVNALRNGLRLLAGADGAELMKMTCATGITEKDVDDFFQHTHRCRKSLLCTDHELHKKAVQLVREHQDRPTFKNAQLAVVGNETAVCFVAGKGRRKFFVEPPAEKIQKQIHVENLMLGFFRLLVALAAIVEMGTAGLSLSAIFTENADVQLSNVTIFLLTLGYLTTLLLGVLVAVETVNPSVSLFSPAYGNINFNGGHGRWLVRATMYAALSSRGLVPLVLSTTHDLLPVTLIGQLEEYSRSVLFFASLVSFILHVLRFFFPKLLKAPWSSPSTFASMHTVSSADGSLDPNPKLELEQLHPGARDKTTDIDNKDMTTTDKKGKTADKNNKEKTTDKKDQHKTTRKNCKRKTMDEVDSSDAMSDVERGVVEDKHTKRVRGLIEHWGSIESFGSSTNILTTIDEDSTEHRCCRQPFKLHSFDAARILKMVALVLCLLLSLIVVAGHMKRLQHHVTERTDQTTQSLPNLFSVCCPLLLGVIVSARLALECIRGVIIVGESTALGLWAVFLLHSASVTTLWSSQTVDWFSETLDWEEDRVSLGVTVFSIISQLAPAALLLIHKRLDRKSFLDDIRHFKPSRNTLSNAKDKLPQFLFSVGVLLSVSGLLVAVLSLPMPIARIRTEYTDTLKTTFQFIRDEFRYQVQDHVQKVGELLGVNICGGKDVEELKDKLRESKAAAAALSVDEIQRFCNDMGWERASKEGDKYCKNYLAARLYFDRKTYNTTIHKPDILEVDSGDRNAVEKYYKELIDSDRRQQLKDMNVDDIDIPEGSVGADEACLQTVCAAKYTALAVSAVPFVGIGGTVTVLLMFALETALKLLIKVAQLQDVFVTFHATVQILYSKLDAIQHETTTLQFSLANFNLIYLSFPVLLTGCVGVLAGFWHRRGAALGRRYRSTMVVVLPLIVFNLLGLMMTVAWTQILIIIGEIAPLIKLTVTPLTAIEGLKPAYGLSITACFLFLLLAAWEKQQNKTLARAPVTSNEATESVAIGNAEKPSENNDQTGIVLEARGMEKAVLPLHDQNSDAASSASETEDEADADTPHNGSPESVMAKRKMTRQKVLGGRPLVWALALVLGLVASGLVTVIVRTPILTFSYDLNDTITDTIDKLGAGAEETTIAKKVLKDTEEGECSVVDFVAKHVIREYRDILNKVDETFFKEKLKEIKSYAKVAAQPALQLLQVPVLLTVYIPTALLLYSFLTSVFVPKYSLYPNSLARQIEALSWMSLGWLANGILFLVTLTQSGAIPLLTVHVSTGGGFAYAVTANVLMILASRELRIGAISPIL